MLSLLISLGLMLLAGVIAALPAGRPKRRAWIATALTIIASVPGLIPCFSILTGSPAIDFTAPWDMPFGSFSLRLDALAAFFLLPIFILGTLGAMYGRRYLLHATAEENLGPAIFCYQVLLVSMALVVLAANGLFFLVAWELTVLSSFFLVVLDRDEEENRHAGWIYLTASHLGTAFIFLLFLLIGRATGSLEFSTFSQAAGLSPVFKGILFLLAIVGFGTKAGFVPLHVWLPEAHPAPPSHVSALMSGVMIKTGVYGIIRFLYFLGHPAVWWGYTLLIIGLAAGILGILFALAQHDLKRLLAYSSVENIGIIALGLGLGLLGLSHANPPVALCGFIGALLHVINHALFKGLLFLGAGAVLEQTGSRAIDRQGGLLKNMPWTGASFLAGCLAISGLPPFNGFISEFFIYLGAFMAIQHGAHSLAIPGLIIIVGLPLIGGLAAACFTKTFSVIFLGAPRDPCAEAAKEVGRSMRIPMAVLSVLCAGVAIGAPFLLGGLSRILLGHPDFASLAELPILLARAHLPLVIISTGSCGLLLLFGVILLARSGLLSERPIGATVTWDCGYAEPTAAMQYTGASFSQPLTDLFHPVLGNETHLTGVEGYFPKKGTFTNHVPNLFLEILYEPLFHRIAALFHRFTWIQNGVVQAYVLYITLTLIALLIGGLM